MRTTVTDWPDGQKQVLRIVHQQGGWYADWDDAPPRGAAQAVARRTGVRWQRAALRHDGHWTEPFQDEDKRILADLYAELVAGGDP